MWSLFTFWRTGFASLVRAKEVYETKILAYVYALYVARQKSYTYKAFAQLVGPGNIQQLN